MTAIRAADASSLYMSRRRSLLIVEFSDRVGKERGLPEWRLLDQESINAFADVTRDWQPIHVDEVAACEGLFGRTVAHGFLTRSLLSAMACEVISPFEGGRGAANYGINSLRCVAPLRSGERVRGRFVLVVIERASSSVQFTFGVTVQIEYGPKPAIVAEWLTLANTLIPLLRRSDLSASASGQQIFKRPDWLSARSPLSHF